MNYQRTNADLCILNNQFAFVNTIFYYLKIMLAFASLQGKKAVQHPAITECKRF